MWLKTRGHLAFGSAQPSLFSFCNPQSFNLPFHVSIDHICPSIYKIFQLTCLDWQIYWHWWIISMGHRGHFDFRYLITHIHQIMWQWNQVKPSLPDRIKRVENLFFYLYYIKVVGRLFATYHECSLSLLRPNQLFLNLRSPQCLT